MADPQGMLDAVLGMPNDCRAAYDSARSVEELPSAEGVASVTFCGMGGSAVSGDVVRSVFLERLGLPVEVNRSPVLPEHCDSHTLVVCSSYSGNTAETLAAFRAAVERGCRVLVVTSGGTIADEAAEHGIAIGARPSRLPTARGARTSGVRVARSARGHGDPPAARRRRDGSGRRGADRARRDGAGRPDRGQPREDARDEDRRTLPGHLGRRRHRLRGRGPLEDADEREREGARVLVVDVRARSQRGGGLDGAVRRAVLRRGAPPRRRGPAARARGSRCPTTSCAPPVARSRRCRRVARPRSRG